MEGIQASNHSLYPPSENADTEGESTAAGTPRESGSVSPKVKQKKVHTVFKGRPSSVHDKSDLKMKTGASLIPNLNLVINRMRSMPDDSYVYLDYMLPKDSEYFTPYSLREVQFRNLNTNKPYFTITRHGVTYWRVSENFFTPLNQWQQEFQQFLSIIQIRTFSIFRLWKGFKVWEKTIKWRKMKNARQVLNDNLFIVIPSLAKAILKMSNEIVCLEKYSFVNISSIEDWHPFYFLEIHMRIYEYLNAVFHDFRAIQAKALCKLYILDPMWIICLLSAILPFQIVQ